MYLPRRIPPARRFAHSAYGSVRNEEHNLLPLMRGARKGAKGALPFAEGEGGAKPSYRGPRQRVILPLGNRVILSPLVGRRIPKMKIRTSYFGMFRSQSSLNMTRWQGEAEVFKCHAELCRGISTLL